MKQYDWQTKLANDPNGWRVPERDPRQYPFGTYTTDDCVLASAGSFIWFEDTQEFLVWLKLAEVKIYDVDGADRTNLVAAVDAAIAKLPQNDGELTPEVLEPIRQAAKGYFCVDWFGPFDQLVSGDTDFALQVRERFWESELEYEESEGALQAPIPAERVDEFLEFLSTYGA